MITTIVIVGVGYIIYRSLIKDNEGNIKRLKRVIRSRKNND